MTKKNIATLLKEEHKKSESSSSNQTTQTAIISQRVKSQGLAVPTTKTEAATAVAMALKAAGTQSLEGFKSIFQQELEHQYGRKVVIKTWESGKKLAGPWLQIGWQGVQYAWQIGQQSIEANMTEQQNADTADSAVTDSSKNEAQV